MTPVFTDASSAILLEKAQLFNPLLKTFKLIFAKSAYKEITKPGYPGANTFAKCHSQDLFIVRSHFKTKKNDDTLKLGKLDAGEKETICLFLAKKEGFILTDDGKAAQWCIKNHLPFINALLVPKVFWYAGFMTKKESSIKMNDLCNIGRYSKKVKRFAFNCSPEDLSYFIPG
ncbi:MAG: hypothetical protein GY699_04730 [Desulfobacteraceae bacterium]|nr:hypothetical protein [Desulfobacteraceae bacterium]